MSHQHLTTAAAWLGALLLGLPANAQPPGNPGGLRPGTPEVAPGQPAPHVPNYQDMLFSMLVGAGGLAEVELGRLAQSKGESAAVKDFAGRMIEDHEAANAELEKLAKAAGITLPTELDPAHQATRDRLAGLSGRDFDLAYMAAQVEDHQTTVSLLEWETGSGQEPGLRAFAVETLPVIFQHLRMAQSVQAELTGGAPPRIAAAEPVPGVPKGKPR